MAWAATLLGIEDITIVMLYIILQTDMIHIANELPDMHKCKIHPIIH